MLNLYTLNIQESLRHAWQRGIGFLKCLAAKVLIGFVHITDAEIIFLHKIMFKCAVMWYNTNT